MGEFSYFKIPQDYEQEDGRSAIKYRDPDSTLSFIATMNT